MAQLARPLKILQVIDRLDAGGAERVMVDLSNILFQNGHQVTTLAILYHGHLEGDLDKDIHRIDLRRTSRFSISHMRKMSREASKNDIVHVHMRHNLKYIWLVKLLFPFKARIIFHDHYGKINVDQSIPTPLKWAMKHTIYIGVSQQLANWAKDTAGMPAESVFHLSNIIIRKEVDRYVKQQNGELKLVLVSNIRKEKNIAFALEIVKKLAESEAVDLTIYGQIVDEGYYQELKALTGALEIAGRVRFVHDCMDLQPELPQYNLAVHTAKSETGPLVLIEYLCQGLPFISFRTGEVIDQLKEEVPGFIMDNFDVQSWTDRIRQIKMVQKGDKLIGLYHKYYSAENYYLQCMKIYETSLTS